MKPTITKYGLFALLTAAVLFLASLVLGNELSYKSQEIIGYTSIIISLSFVFFGIKHFRDKENGGQITFRKAFIIGIFISLFAALGFAIIDYLYTAVINPDFMAEFAANIKENGGEMTETYTSTSLALFIFSIVLVIGFIVTLLSAFILQRK
ncbi:MAG: DUF4199 domain-containing protein [Flavobacteriaceae bacterium]|nr:DUF4199 domain-containing protein [Flavobacteriaceae bacterium]